MSDSNTGGGPGVQSVPSEKRRTPFPITRLIYAICFAVVAWFVFWVVLMLAIVQFLCIAVDGKANNEVKNLTLNLVQYLWELIAYVTFLRDEQPFPLGSFPHANGTSTPS